MKAPRSLAKSERTSADAPDIFLGGGDRAPELSARGYREFNFAIHTL